MNAIRSAQGGKTSAADPRSMRRLGFTLVEILVVVAIIGTLVAIMGSVVTNTIRKAREAATIALIQKIDGLLDERVQGFERATKSRDFQRIIEARRRALEQSGVFGVSPKVIEAVARKDYFRQNFPQRLEDLPDTNGNFIPDAFEPPPLGNPQITLVVANFRDSNLANRLAREQNEQAESSELLYYMLTRMQVFGVPPVAESEFDTNEVRDTDGDGLLEFIDSWGHPLRFYRWPTRLLKPNGILGADNQPGAAGVDDDGNGATDDFLERGKGSTDDIVVPLSQREVIGLVISGKPPIPPVAGQWDALSEDPDDPYGLISTEIKRLYMTGIDVTAGAGGFNELNYPTIDTLHVPLIVSAGPDNAVGLFEPFLAWDSLLAGAAYAGDSSVDYGILAQPIYGTAGNPYDIPATTISALTDNLTNQNRRAGGGK